MGVGVGVMERVRVVVEVVVVMRVLLRVQGVLVRRRIIIVIVDNMTGIPHGSITHFHAAGHTCGLVQGRLGRQCRTGLERGHAVIGARRRRTGLADLGDLTIREGTGHVHHHRGCGGIVTQGCKLGLSELFGLDALLVHVL